MKKEEYLLLLRKYRWTLLMITGAFTLTGLYFLKPYLYRYQSESTFYVSDESQLNPLFFSRTNNDDLLRSNPSQERLSHLIYSTEMMRFLVDRFKLYDVYGIDTANRYHFEHAVIILSSRITISTLGNDMKRVTVADRNNERAAAMTNAVVWKLDQLNKRYLLDKINASLSYYDSYLKESEKITGNQNEILRRQIEIFGNVRKLEQERESKSGILSLADLEFSIYTATARISELTSQMVFARNLFDRALNTQKNENLPGFIIIKKAMPDFSSKKLILAVGAVSVAFVGLAIVLIFAYFYIIYKDELLVIFGKRS